MNLQVDALARLKVKELQRELKERGLDTGGLKAALLQRLRERLLQEQAPETEATPQKTHAEPEDTQADEEEDKHETEETKEAEKKQTEVEEDTQKEVEEDTQKEVSPEDPEPPKSRNGTEAVEDEKPSLKRGADEVEKEEEAPTAKKAKVEQKTESGSPQPEDEDSEKPDAANGEKAEEDAEPTRNGDEKTNTIRIDNFVRPFTLNAVKALVQDVSDYVDGGFWIDSIKTHCFVTYPSAEIAEKTSAALEGKVWPPENGRALKVTFSEHTAMEVSKFGEANLPSRPMSADSDNTEAPQRQKVTIDEFFQKTETKPVLYYLPLTDEQVEQRKQNQSQQPEGQPRKRRHRGGRKRNRRARFRR